MSQRPFGKTVWLALWLLTGGTVLAQGTVDSVALVADLAPGSRSEKRFAPDELVLVDGRLFFSLYSPLYGRELWTSDGTAEGTELFADLCPGRCSSDPLRLTVVGDRFYFQACDPHHGCQLWTSDATRAGTLRLTDEPGRFPEPFLENDWLRHLTAWGERLVFVQGGNPWISDATPAGTTLLADLDNVSYAWPEPAVTDDSKLFVSMHLGPTLWASPGVGQPLAMVADFGAERIYNAFAATNRLFFVVLRSDGGQDLWTSDGTPEHTMRLLADIASLDLGLVFQDKTYFIRSGELWASDGSPAGTGPVAGLPPTASLAFAAVFDDHLYVKASIGGRYELWRFDGSTATFVDEIPSFALEFQAAANFLYFTVRGSSLRPYRRALWRTAGTTGSTVELRGDLSSLSGLVELDGRLFMAARADEHASLVASDGTVEGTGVAVEFRAPLGSLTSSPLDPPRGTAQSLVDHGGTLFFSAPGIDRIARSDGTAAGTVLISDDDAALVQVAGRLYFLRSGHGLTSPSLEVLAPDAMSLIPLLDDEPGHIHPSTALAFGWQLFFLSQDSMAFFELWTSNGTAAATARVAGGLSQVTYGCPGGCAAPPPFPVVALDDAIFFGLLEELWKSDGTAAGTVRLFSDTHSLCPECPLNWFLELERSGEAFYFTIYSHDSPQLWKSDGTMDGTRRVATLAGASVLNQLTDVEGTLFFTAGDAELGRELWRSDGTAEGTRLVRDIRAGSEGSDPRHLTAVGGRLFFSADDGIHGPELWLSDATAAGTRLVCDIRPGPEGSALQELTAIDDRLYFTAENGVHGLEPWASDATAAGTVLVRDVSEGFKPSSPHSFAVSGGRLFFAAADEAAGFELRMIEEQDVPFPLFVDGFETGNVGRWSRATENFRAGGR